MTATSLWGRVADAFTARGYQSPWRSIARHGQIIPSLTEGWLIWLFLAGRGAGKLLTLDTPLPTPTGWTTMGEVRVGDVVLDEAGQPTRVTWASPRQVADAWRVTFSDGSSLVAHGEHQWVTWTAADRKAFLRSPYEDIRRFPKDWPAWRLRRMLGRTTPQEVVERALRLQAEGHSTREIAATVGYTRNSLLPHLRAGRYVEREPVIHLDAPGPQVRTTDEIRATLRVGKRGDLNHAIPTCEPLNLPDADLPIDPYVLGVWLGDGHSAGGTVTMSADDAKHIREHVEAAGYVTTDHRVQADRTPNFGVLGLRTHLRRAGLLMNKHVPAEYLRASAAQRLALLQGLMDTDGGVDRGSCCSFTNINQSLTDAVHELAVSLGMVVWRDERPAKLNGLAHGVAYRAVFTPTLPVFRLPRKLTRVVLDGPQGIRRRHRRIVSVERLPDQEMRCIAVDSPHRLYLAGRDMIPTHNTRSAAEAIAELMRRYPGCRVALVGVIVADGRDTMVEGESGLLACLDDSELRGGGVDKAWNRSIGELYLANGSQAKTFTSEKPRKLRGPQHHFAWADEAAQFTDAWHDRSALDTTWSNLMLGLRLPAMPGWPADYAPRVIVTTTPRRVALLKVPAQIAREEPHRAGLTQLGPDEIRITHGTTWENLGNLADAFRLRVVEPLRGTRLGQQELDAVLLDDVEGALVQQSWIDRGRVAPDAVPVLAATVTAVDPATTVTDSSDETGIVTSAVDGNGEGYVLDDSSGKYSPEEWGIATWKAAIEHQSVAVVCEDNQGGDMVEHVLKIAWLALVKEQHAKGVTLPGRPPIVRVHPSGPAQGKWVRAQPVALLYEQSPGRIHHAAPPGTGLDRLEDQLTAWTGDPAEPSPDRVDALVHGLSWLLFPARRRTPKDRLPAAAPSQRWAQAGGRR